MLGTPLRTLLVAACLVMGGISAQGSAPGNVPGGIPVTTPGGTPPAGSPAVQSQPVIGTSVPVQGQGAGAGIPASSRPGITTLPTQPRTPALTLNLPSSDDPKSLGNALEIVLLLTGLSLAPAIILTMTCFTRIIIVLSFLKRAMSMQELPPAMVVTGFAVFLSIFIMKPVVMDLYSTAYLPYAEGQIAFDLALDKASMRMNSFMLQQTRPEDIALILDLSEAGRPNTPADVPIWVTIPSFILSEMKTAFQMGFVLFLPFVVIDLVTAALLVSMGMFTLPPVVVSTPLKLLLFVMVDGWNLVVRSLAVSFTQT